MLGQDAKCRKEKQRGHGLSAMAAQSGHLAENRPRDYMFLT